MIIIISQFNKYHKLASTFLLLLLHNFLVLLIIKRLRNLKNKYMADKKKPTDKSRRWFVSGGLLDTGKKDMVKMLTADGKIVEIERSVLEAAAKKQKSTNKEIYDWMKNPSKENNS